MPTVGAATGGEDMSARAVEQAGSEDEPRENGDGFLGIVRAVQIGALFWAGLGLVIWLW